MINGSGDPLNAANVHERCNLGARYRWGIETNFLVEKHQGYAYEHCFAKDWNAMRGYHYLMRTTLTGPWLDKYGLTEVEQLMQRPLQLRFV